MKILKILTLLSICFVLVYAQGGQYPPENSVLRNFRTFPTPRTNYRPGTVYRIAPDGKQYVVEDVANIQMQNSEEGNIKGRMTFTDDELLGLLNIEFDAMYIVSEVEMNQVTREFTEQTLVDKVLWEDDKVDDLVVDRKSRYFIIREAVVTDEITFRFSQADYERVVSGKGNLSKMRTRGDIPPDFPWEITKSFNEPKRIFYLDQEIGREHYKERR